MPNYLSQFWQRQVPAYTKLSDDESDAIAIELTDTPDNAVEITSLSQPLNNASDTISDYQTISRLMALIWEPDNRPRILSAALLTLITTILNFAPPFLLGETIQSFSKEDQTYDFGGLEIAKPTVFMTLLIASFFLSRLMPNLRNQVLTPVGPNNAKKLIDRFTQHQLQKSLYYHATTPFSEQMFLFQKGFSTSAVISPLLPIYRQA